MIILQFTSEVSVLYVEPDISAVCKTEGKVYWVGETQIDILRKNNGKHFKS